MTDVRFEVVANGRPNTIVLGRLRTIRGVVERALRAGINDMRTAAKAHTAQALGTRVGNTWRRPKVVTGDPDNFNMRAYFSSKVPQIIRSFEYGATIRARRKKYMAIPLPGTTRGRGAFQRKKLTPETYQAQYGKLTPVPLKNGRILLVDRGASHQKAKTGGIKIVRRASKKQPRGVPVFVLLPRSQSVTLNKRLNLASIEKTYAERTRKNILSVLNADTNVSAAA